MRIKSLLAIAAIAASACHEGATGPKGPLGTYGLQTVNTATLPFLAEDTPAGRIVINSGNLIFADDGTYTGQVVSTLTVNGSASTLAQNSSGTFTVSGSQLTFKETGTGAQYQGVLDGDKITAVRSNVTFGFLKR